MPRKTKDVENKEKEDKKSKSTKTTAKKSTTNSKKSTAKKTTKAKTTTKKVSTKKSVSKKVASKKTGQPNPEPVTEPVTTPVEYYDLPYRYNQTIVKVLAQTPTTLFIYWDISDEDRENYKKQFGEDFFNTTKPILKIYNDTMHYSFEVEINDFANSWYLHINDSKCDYRVELGRRPVSNQNSDYIYISSSNEIEVPNDRILFNVDENMVYFKNAKTNAITTKSIAHLAFIRNMGKIYNIYDLYQKEDIDNLNNPSSNFI